MKKKGLYQLKKSDKKIKEYTLSVLTEDKAGLLNHITIIFNRRKMNINSLNVIYNLADFLNKIIFGMIIYSAAIQDIIKTL